MPQDPPLSEAGSDVPALIASARRAATRTRAAHRAVIEELYGAGVPVLSERHRSLVVGALLSLVRDMSDPLKQAAADWLETHSGASESLVPALMAVTAEEIYGVVAGAGLFSRFDLVETALHRVMEYRMRRSMRGRETGFASFEDTGAARRAEHMLRAASFSAAHATRAYQLELAQRVDGYGHPILTQSDLPADFAMGVRYSIAAALRSVLLRRLTDARSLIDAALDAALVAEGAGHDGMDTADARLMRIATSLVEAGLIEHALLVELLEAGEVVLVIALMAVLAKVPPRLVRRFFNEASFDGLAVLARAVGMDRAIFMALCQAIAHARQGSGAASGAPAPEAGLFARLDQEAARSLAAYWGRDRPYLAALRAIETSQPLTNPAAFPAPPLPSAGAQ